MTTKIQISGNANANLPSYTLDEAERMLAEYPPGGLPPKDMDKLSRRYWAKHGKAKPVAGADEDISDLIPTPKTHEEIWAKWNTQGRGRTGGAK